MNYQDVEYAGFWVRTGAALIDSILIGLITIPILLGIYGEEYFGPGPAIKGAWDFLLSYVLPAIATVLFWMYRSATPGKMLVKATIVDAGTGNIPTTGQFLLRYLGYFAAIIPLMLGIIWVAFDSRKQGWHDKIAGTVVIKTKDTGPVPVAFEKQSENDTSRPTGAAHLERHAKEETPKIKIKVTSLIDWLIRIIALLGLIPLAWGVFILSIFATDSPSSGFGSALIVLAIGGAVCALIGYSSLAPAKLARPFGDDPVASLIIGRTPAYLFAAFVIYYLIKG